MILVGSKDLGKFWVGANYSAPRVWEDSLELSIEFHYSVAEPPNFGPKKLEIWQKMQNFGPKT